MVADLGKTLASSPQTSVVLVDADSRRPALHRPFCLGLEDGLGDLIEDVYWVDVANEDTTQFGLGDWVELLRAQRRTGDLWASDATHTFSLRFFKGAVCGIAAVSTIDRHRLGELLVEGGRISPEQRERALVVQRETGRPLGDILCTLGVVAADDLVPMLRAQSNHRLEELMGLRHPLCAFSERAEPYLSVVQGRIPSLPEPGCIDGVVTGHLRAYLGDPFLSHQIPGYLRDTALPNLKVLPAGSRAIDLLSARHLIPFELILQRLSNVFDFVLVDAPAVSLQSPTTAIATTVDGVLLVVRSGYLETALIQRAIERLRQAGGKVVGAVLTHADLPDPAAPSHSQQTPDARPMSAERRGSSLARPPEQ